MPKILGYTNYHPENPGAIIKKEDFEVVWFKINQEKIKGKNVYGFFVTDEEWEEKVSAIVCRDGSYKIPTVEYEKGETIKDEISAMPVDNDEVKRITSKKNIENFVGREGWMRKKLIKLKIPARKIRFWHRLGWSFKT